MLVEGAISRDAAEREKVKAEFVRVLVKARNSTCPLARDKWIFRRGSVARQILVSTLILSGMSLLFMKSTKTTT